MADSPGFELSINEIRYAVQRLSRSVRALRGGDARAALAFLAEAERLISHARQLIADKLDVTIDPSGPSI